MRTTDLLLGAAAVASVLAVPTTDGASSSSSTKVQKRASPFEFAGVNESGAEFGSNLPGTEGTDYTWPLESSIDTLLAKGFNTFRIPILMERLIPTSLNGTIDSTYYGSLNTLITYITGKGAYAIIDPHNYGRYYGNIMDADGMKAWWTTVAGKFKSNKLVIFDTNNEYHDMENQLVADLNQAAIDGIRAAGATSQYIFVEGNSWTGAWHWISSGTDTTMGELTDPNDNIIYEFHQYLDSDGSGTSADCVSSTVGSERLAVATAWLKANNKIGVLGETAGGANTQCIDALTDMFSYMSNNTDVWTGWLWWGGGPWWGDYIYSMEPPSGDAYTGVLPDILSYV